jgi:phenylacetate-CoA ligase
MGMQNNPFLQKLYAAAPVSVQSAAVSALGAQIRYRRYNRSFREQSEEYIRRQWKGKEYWTKHQQQKLSTIVSHARKTTDHYRDLPDDFQLDPAVRVEEQMDTLPFLDSEVIKERPMSLVSSEFNVSDCISHSTSGTTGTPKTTYHTPSSQRKYWAAMERFYRRGGVRYGDRRLSFTGNKIVPTGDTSGPYSRYDRANNRLLMSAYHLGEDTVDQYLDEIEQFSPDFIDGYPSSISYCAQRAIETNRHIRVPATFPTAETLRQEDRRLIRKGFSTQVYNQYGSMESAALITECPTGTWHVNPEIGIVEVLDEGGNRVSEGEIGELVLTGLNNKAMPLIRYRIGDMARGPPEYEMCECGWHTPTIKKVIGRQDEIVITADGRRIPMLSYNVFKYADSIEESQIVQESVDEFIIRIVPGQGYSSEQAKLVTQKLKDRVGQDISVEIELLEDIPRTTAGKFRAVISRVE